MKLLEALNNTKTLYHGTIRDFDEFKYGEFGVHLGTLKSAKDVLAKNNIYVEKSKKFITVDINGYILTVKVNIEKPLRINDDFGNWEDANSWMEYLTKHNVTSRADRNYLKKFYTDLNLGSRNRVDYPAEKKFSEEVKKVLMRSGYDSIRYINEHEDIGNPSYIIFDPSKIKIVDKFVVEPLEI